MSGSCQWSSTDKGFMHFALELAEKSRGRTSPNPLVGAVIVRDNTIVGEGYHQKAGEAHAEVHALNQAGELARGATLYVTLEPCCHWGRTQPCTKAIVRAGIANAFVAVEDPNPRVNGNGMRELRDAGIQVNVGLFEREARRLNEVYLKYAATKQPFVILKAACSLDGKIATASGESQWITSQASRTKGHEIRDQVDAILVGVETVLNDNPSLSTRLPNRRGKNPIRIVMDSHARTPPTAKILNPDYGAGAIVAVTERANSENLADLKAVGAEILAVQEKDGRVCMEMLMFELGRRSITSVLVEGGGEVNASALRAGIVDKVMFFYAPKLIGGSAAAGPIGGEGIQCLSEAYKLRDLTVTHINGDFLVEGYLKPNA